MPGLQPQTPPQIGERREKRSSEAKTTVDGLEFVAISLAREWPRKAIPNIFRRLHGLAAESTANLALTPTGS